MTFPTFLTTHGQNIVTSDGKPVILKGVNLGGWLMMEGYILHSPNLAEQIFKKNFASALGKRTLKDFEKDFRGHFIQESDFKKIAGFGFNCIRLPFNGRLIEQLPYQYDADGIKYLDQAVAWAKKYKIWLILDLHAARGAQNHDWHSDSLGKALLWEKKEFRARTFKLWEFLADRYKEEPTIAGYDLLNEPVLDDTQLLNAFYKELIQAIRRVDRRHILFVEGNRWAQDIECLDNFSDDNLAFSVHTYVPLEFTFNFIPHLHYPLKTKTNSWGKKDLRKLLSGYSALAQKKQRPVLVGEFGVNDREGLYGEDQWVKDIVSCFKEFGFHWTYWTYKAIKNNVFPDGLLSYMENPPWVNRAGPAMGWDTYSALWPEKRRDIVESWKTENFAENSSILKVLKHAANQNHQFPKSSS